MPTGTYNRYSFQYNNFDDYPKMGVWPDGYYETFNMFNGNTFVGADVCAYKRSAMLNDKLQPKSAFNGFIGRRIAAIGSRRHDCSPGGLPELRIEFRY